MPTPATPSGPRGIARYFRRIMRWMGVACLLAAAMAVWLVARGEPGNDVRILIVVALGAGLSVLLAAALIMLAFIRPGKPRRRRPAGGEGEIQA